MPPPSFLMMSVCAEPPTRDTEMPAFIAGRMPALNKSVSRKIWPSVIEMTFVGTNADDVAGLRLDDRAAPVSEPVLPFTRAVGDLLDVLLVHARGALEQARVQIEHVAGIRFAARRAAQQQRDLAIRPRLLGQVVIDDERVFAVVAEVLAHRAAGVRRDVLHRRRARRPTPRRRSCAPSRRALRACARRSRSVDCFWPIAT